MKVRYVWVLFLLATIISIVYSNTIDSDWQLDDKANIVHNQGVHINELSLESIWKASFSKAFHYNYRPLPNLSFGFNWYFGGSNPKGYHIINIAIHVLSSFFLFFLILNLFKSPNLKDKYDSQDTFFVSLLSAILWALNPIQTQAVTYIVQRMTSMSAMFYVISILSYVMARNHTLNKLYLVGNSRIRMPALFFYFLSIASYFCAFFSKENAAILPLSIIIVEAIFFRDLSDCKINWMWIVPLVSVFFSVAVIAVLVFTDGNFLFFVERYKYRPFTIYERLFTEPRVVLHYLTQIFYPMSERLSIAHDVTISKNILQPWTTFPSIMVIFALVFTGFAQTKKRPLLSFAILFYFLNHVVESTVLPLELVFEHRNYLPSMFLFLPFAEAINSIIKRNRDKNRTYLFVVIIFVTLLIVFFGLNTFRRNSVWKTNLSIWYDALRKAPKDLRSANNVATALAWREGAVYRDFDTAIFILNKALTLNNIIRKDVYREIYGNLGNLYFKKNNFEKAIWFHKKSLEVDPSFSKGRFDLVSPLIMLGKWKEATLEIDMLIKSQNGHLRSDYFNVKGLTLLWLNKPEDALPYFRIALRLAPWDQSVYLNIGRALSMSGYYKNAEWFLLRVSKNNPSNIIALFCLIENSIKAGEKNSAEKYAEKILYSNDIISINSALKSLPNLFTTAPITQEIIKPVITKKILQLVAQQDS